MVMAISATLVAIAIPSYLSWKPGHYFRGAVSQVRSDLNDTKMRALEKRVQSRIVFTANGYTIQVGNRATGSNNWTVVATKDFAEFPGITITTTDTFVFYPRGTADANSIIMQHDNGMTQTFSTTIAGRIRLQ